MIINHTYFQLPPLEIPNAIQGISIRTGSETPDNIKRLNAVIDRVEHDLLINALGYEQYTELQSQFTDNGDWIDEPLQKWVDLVDGKGEWKGLRYTLGTNKVSLIAYYVYYKFLSQSVSYFTTTGLVTNRGENGQRMMPEGEMCDMWNAFVYMYQGGYDYRFKYLNWCVCDVLPYDYSLLRFLTSNSDVYNTSFFRCYELKNMWSI